MKKKNEEGERKKSKRETKTKQILPPQILIEIIASMERFTFNYFT